MATGVLLGAALWTSSEMCQQASSPLICSAIWTSTEMCQQVSLPQQVSSPLQVIWTASWTVSDPSYLLLRSPWISSVDDLIDS